MYPDKHNKIKKNSSVISTAGFAWFVSNLKVL